MKEINVDELRRRLEVGEDLVVLDVREPDEVDRAAIPGSVNIPLGEAERVHEWRRALHRRLYDAGCIDWPLTGQTVALAEAAVNAGAVWIPLDLR